MQKKNSPAGVSGFGFLTGKALALAAVSSLALAPSLATPALAASALESYAQPATAQDAGDSDQKPWEHHHKKPKHHGGGNGVLILLGALAVGGAAAAAASGGHSAAAPPSTPQTATDYSESITLAGTVGSATGAVDTSLHGQALPITLTADNSAAGFTESVTFTTPGGSVVATAGGVNKVVSYVGGLIAGTYGITSSTDAGIATSGSGLYQIFDQELGLQYASFGLWQLSNCADSTSCLPLYVGSFGGAAPGQTLTATMPTLTGYASYWGGAVGYVQQPSGKNTNNLAEFLGTLGLSANLGTGDITGGITGGRAYTLLGSGTQTLIGTVNDIAISGTISGNTYTGTTTASTTAAGVAPTGFDISGASGHLIGGFYGPSAQETGGTFYLNGGTNGTSLVGSLGAARNTNVLTSTQFSVSGAVTTTLNQGLALSLGSIGTVTDSYTNDYSPDQFTKFIYQGTQGGALVLMEGGANTYNANATLFGQTGVAAGKLGIVNSAVSGITTSDGGNWQLFGNAVGLTYANFGVWEVNPCANTASCTPSYVGVSAGARAGNVETTNANMPTTGSAGYSGGATGFIQQPTGVNTNNTAQFYGTASLTANFISGGGTITGAVTGITAYTTAAIPASLGTVNDIAFTGGTISGAEYTAAASVSGGAGTAFDITGASGSVQGAFYGTSGPAETAGVFTMTAGNGTHVTGAFGAVKVVAPSDRRLKQDITPAGALPNGLKLYSWRYLGGQHRFTGVMAQDLLSDARFSSAVERDGDGLMRVDYEAIGYQPADMATMRAEGEAAVALYRATLH